MRVVIVTGTAPHHKNLCVSLAKSHEVVGILHPARKRRGFCRTFSTLRDRVRCYGLPLVMLHLSRWLPVGCCTPSCGLRSDQNFNAAEREYSRIPKTVVHNSCDVRRSETHSLIRSLSPDVTLCLGGPVYPKSFIEASPLTLNFHSGISPIYNGAGSIEFAFANGHPHLCGGTMMLMSTEVDGGGILAHYLPEISFGESPASLFRKTVEAAPLLYSRVVDGLHTSSSQLKSVRQPWPLFYTRGFQFGWHHKAMISQNLRKNVSALFQRPPAIVEYWREPTELAATEMYLSTINSLLWGSPRETKK